MNNVIICIFTIVALASKIDSSFMDKRNFDSNNTIDHNIDRLSRKVCVRNVPKSIRSLVEFEYLSQGSDPVTRQYESLPYPPVENSYLKDEEQFYKRNTHIKAFIPHHSLENINHYFHRGKENFANSYRLIVAGGGTGAVTLFYGEQLNHTNAEIMYLDFSSASMQISKKRARFRKIGNIIWIQSWIEEVKYLGAGLFESSECSGVLHHMKSPIQGLKILKDVLISNGGMNLMVYAEIGRKAVYQIQHILSIVKWRNDVGILKELEVANHTLTSLPADHWFYVGTQLLDWKLGNIGIYDLLLHKRDVAFSVSSLGQWIVEGGLRFVDYNLYKTRFRFNVKNYNLDETLERTICIQSKINQWSISEFLFSNLIKHSFYISKDASSEAKLSDPYNRFFLWGNPIGLREAFRNPINRKVMRGKKMFLCPLTSTYLPILSEYYMKERILKEPDGEFAIEINPFSEFLMNAIPKYHHGVGLKSLYSEYRKLSNASDSDQKLYKLTRAFYTSIKDTGLILLRADFVFSFPKSSSISLFRVTSM